jgi:hypothetical protein
VFSAACGAKQLLVSTAPEQLYVGVCAALDAWRVRRSRRLDREAWFAEQARIHRDSKSM